MKPFSLYEDARKTTTDNPDVEGLLVEIDMSEPHTLYSMCKPFRDATKDKPDDLPVTLYLVCGNTCSRDAGLLAEYFKGVSNPLQIAFRGIVHFDFIQLFLDHTVYLNTESQIVYSKTKLHDTLKNLLLKPEAYKKFMQRFVDEYWRLNEGNLLPYTELLSLGIKVELL